jgi:hypothetical protein
MKHSLGKKVPGCGKLLVAGRFFAIDLRASGTFGNVFWVWPKNKVCTTFHTFALWGPAGEKDFRLHDTLVVNVYRAECITHERRDCQQHFAHYTQRPRRGARLGFHRITVQTLTFYLAAVGFRIHG